MQQVLKSILANHPIDTAGQPDELCPMLVQANAVKALLAHRISPKGSAAAKSEWYEIVEGQHALWRGMSEPYKHTIRAFLVYFHTQILRHSTERFNFSNGSVGGISNTFCAG